MSMRHHVRAGVALAAAYAVALQAILLAIGAPGGVAGELAALPICSTLGSTQGGGHSAPGGQTHDCLGACLGCGCGTPVCPTAGPALGYAPAPLHIIAAAVTARPLLQLRATGAHRSRAPPFA